MSVTDEIKARLDIVSYIQQYAPLKKAGRNYKAACPFHNEKTPSFVVNPETQTWRCFGSCADGGDIFSFAQKYHGWEFREALHELAVVAGVEVQQQSEAQQQQAARLDALRGLLQTAADFYHEQLGQNPAVLNYARERRGFSAETLATYGIGYAPQGWQATLDYLTNLGHNVDDLIEVGLVKRSENGREYDYFRNRLIIPIRDERGRVIGFGARALADEDNPKYLNSPQTPLFDKSRVLFGLDRAKRALRDTETAVIVEGYMDVIQAHQAGFMNVVAQMGTAMTETQLKTLSPRWAKKIVLALDADAAGQNATMRSLEVARDALKADYTGKLSVDMRILQIPDAKDPDDLIRETPQDWPPLVEAALPVVDYVIAMETATLSAQASVQEREAVARRLLPILLASENNLYTKDNIQKLALRLHIGENELLNWAAEQERIQQSKAPRASQTNSQSAMPEPPPLDYDEMLGPPTGDDDQTDYVPIPPPTRRPQTGVGRWEVDCLGGLLQQPDLLYQINRTFRELAGSADALLAGPLADFGISDFSHTDYQVLMEAFLIALDQDDMPPLDYLLTYLDELPRQVLETEVLVNNVERLRPQLRHGLSADLTMVLQRTVTVDPRTELVKNALRLRLKRIEREREELYFLLMEADAEQQAQLHEHTQLSIIAKGLIDAELQRQGKRVY